MGKGPSCSEEEMKIILKKKKYLKSSLDFVKENFKKPTSFCKNILWSH